MALIKAFAGALGGTFADQWLDIITVGQFGEHVALMPGVYQETNQGRSIACPGCGATLTGWHGKTVICEYCSASRQL